MDPEENSSPPPHTKSGKIAFFSNFLTNESKKRSAAWEIFDPLPLKKKVLDYSWAHEQKS